MNKFQKLIRSNKGFTIPSTVESLGRKAFERNKLTTIMIENNSSIIDGSSFNDNGPDSKSNGLTSAPYNGTWRLTSTDNYTDLIK